MRRRKNLLALGLVLIFMGLVFIAVSRIVVKPEPLQKWVVVEEVEAGQSADNLFLNGHLTQGDRFRVYFSLGPVSGGRLSVDATVLINLTDPIGHVKLYEIPIMYAQGKLTTRDRFPEVVANYTGAHKVNARGIWGVSLTYLALQKMEIEEKEPQYPYIIFLPVGFAVLLGGVGTSILGVKTSKRKRTRYKSRLPKRKG